MIIMASGCWLMLVSSSAGFVMAHRRVHLMSGFWVSNCDSLRFTAAGAGSGLMARCGRWCVSGRRFENSDGLLTFTAGRSRHFLLAAASSGKMACHGS